MARKEHHKQQNVRALNDKPQTRDNLTLELHQEINKQERFDEDIPRPENVAGLEHLSKKEIKDREGLVDRNQFGTIELHAESPRKWLTIPLTTDRIQTKSIRRVLAEDLGFEHFAERQL